MGVKIEHAGPERRHGARRGVVGHTELRDDILEGGHVDLHTVTLERLDAVKDEVAVVAPDLRHGSAVSGNRELPNRQQLPIPPFLYKPTFKRNKAYYPWGRFPGGRCFLPRL